MERAYAKMLSCKELKCVKKSISFCLSSIALGVFLFCGGEMAEWTIVPDSKSGVGVTPPRV